MGSVKPTARQIKNFWKKVNKSGRIIDIRIGPCWIWTGSKDKDGYGRTHLDGCAKNVALRDIMKINEKIKEL